MVSIKPFFCGSFVILALLAAQAAGAAPREHSFIRPIPGFQLYDTEFENFAAFEFKVEQADGDIGIQRVKGKYWELIYEYEKTDRTFSPLEIIENYRQEALKKGGKVLSGDDVYLDFTVPLPQGGTSWVHLWSQENYYELTIVDQEGFKKRLTFSAKEMKDKLDTEGHVAIYGILFDFDKADLKVGSEKVLTEMVKLMKEYPELKVEIQGHTDNVGGRDYNLDLSERRARTVRDYLSLYGIASSRMTIKGYGFDMPVASNDTEEGRALNRRVELKKR
jgi:outer membrane protein OmpA-like peptidoglycan-associated protein